MKLYVLVVFALLTGSIQEQVTFDRLLHANQETQEFLTAASVQNRDYWATAWHSSICG